MLNPERQEHIINLEQALTDIGSVRQRISKLLEDKLTKEQRKLIETDILGNFMFLQSSISGQVQRLKSRRD